MTPAPAAPRIIDVDLPYPARRDSESERFFELTTPVGRREGVDH